MRILLTGPTGFLGRHVVGRLAPKHELAALTRARGRLPAGVEELEMDLARPLEVTRLPSSVDVIIHLAQADRDASSGAELLAVNTLATRQLLDYGRRAGAHHFILASSGDVYGRRKGPAQEVDTAAPASDYAVSKRAAEMLVESEPRTLVGCVLRLFHPYGPGQTGRLVPKLAERIRDGTPVRITREGGPGLSPIYVEDVIHALERAIEARHAGTVNVAGDAAVGVRQLAEEIGRLLGVVPRFEEVENDGGDILGDNRLMKSVFGAWSLVSLSEGLARTLKRW